MRGVLLLCLCLAAAPCAAASPMDSAVLDAVAGGPRRGAWTVGAKLGYPWSAVQAQVGIGHRLSLLVAVETALFRRWQPAAGLGVLLLDRRRLRLSGELWLGWLFQEGTLARRGPSGALGLRLGVPLGRWVPYLHLGTRHTLLPDRTRIERADGTEVSFALRHEWTPSLGLGLGVAIHRAVGLDAGLDWSFVDAPGTISIPGAHLGFYFGGGR